MIVFSDVKAGKSTLGNFISGYSFELNTIIKRGFADASVAPGQQYELFAENTKLNFKAEKTEFAVTLPEENTESEYGLLDILN